MAAGCLAAVLVLARANIGQADGLALDEEIDGGRYFTQASPEASSAERLGFTVTDRDGVRFWSEFRRLGGTTTLGYPISRRFTLEGFTAQAFQRGILRWHPEAGEGHLYNVMDASSILTIDAHALAAHFLPTHAPQATAKEQDGWLSQDGGIHAKYRSIDRAAEVLGSPTAPPADFGPVVALRFQRGVIHRWKSTHPWTDDHGASLANVGDLARERGLIPAAALQPEPPPTEAERARVRAARGLEVTGVATWYGRDFHGALMANGRPFNMWNPSTAASNIFPLGSLLRVTRVVTGASIVVRVTDRGAFRHPNLVDLSYAAFASFADPDDGVIRVRVERVG